MPNQQSVVELIFQGVDKTGAATSAALSNVSQFSGGVQAATQPIANFTTSALKLEATLLAAGVAVTAFSVKIAGDFDTAFREISTLINQPIEDLDEFKAAILSYASTSTKPLEEVTQSIYNAISAGVDYADSIEAVSLAEKLSVAGKATLNESLVVLVSSLNAYGLGMDEAERFSDALFTTVKQGQTTLPELAGSLASVTGLAATAGVDFEELLAAIATLTATGTPTSQAVTQIQGAISAILKPTSQAASLAKELGLEFNVSRLQAVGLTGILEDVKQATGGNAEQMALLFGRVEALNGVLTLTGLGADKFAENLRAMSASAGSVDQAFSIMVQSADASAQKIQNALTSIFIAVGAPLLDEFGGTADAIAEIFNAIGDAARSGDNGVAELVEFIESQFAGLQDTLENVARNLPAALELADFSGFSSGIQAVTSSISGLFDNIDLSTAEGLADAITIVGNAFNGLSQFTGGVIESLEPLFDQFTDVAGGLRDLDESFFSALGNAAGFATQANVLAGALNDMIPAIQGVLAVIGINQTAGLVGGLARAVGGVGALGTALGSAGLAAGAGAAGFAIGTLANKASELATGQSISTWIADGIGSLTGLNSEFESLTATVDVSRIALEQSPSNNGVADALEEIIVTAERWDPGVFSAPLQEIEVTAQRVESAFQSNASAIGEIIPIYDEATGKLLGYSDGLAGATTLIGSFSDSSALAAAATRDFAEASEQITLDEKLALIDSRTQITVAGIEAGARTMESAFESVNTSIESTGDTLSSLFGLLGDENISKFDKLDLSKEIERESERRDAALALQEKLIAAQARLANAQAERLKDGGALINVNGDGLQPHLEAISYSLFEAIQVRVNADGYELLLGTAP
jgi:TP901 family phage tail tape measure protein